MTEQSSTKNADSAGTSSASSSSASSPSLSLRELVRLAFGAIVAAVALWYLHTDREVPWAYRFWGSVGIAGAAILPARVTEAVVAAVLSRLPMGGGK